MRKTGEIGHSEVVIVILASSPLLFARSATPSFGGNYIHVMENTMFVLNNEEQHGSLAGWYDPSDDYLFLDTSFKMIHEASAFIQKQFCKVTNAKSAEAEIVPGQTRKKSVGWSNVK